MQRREEMERGVVNNWFHRPGDTGGKKARISFSRG